MSVAVERLVALWRASSCGRERSGAAASTGELHEKTRPQRTATATAYAVAASTRVAAAIESSRVESRDGAQRTQETGEERRAPAESEESERIGAERRGESVRTRGGRSGGIPAGDASRVRTARRDARRSSAPRFQTVASIVCQHYTALRCTALSVHIHDCTGRGCEHNVPLASHNALAAAGTSEQNRTEEREQKRTEEKS